MGRTAADFCFCLLLNVGSPFSGGTCTLAGSGEGVFATTLPVDGGAGRVMGVLEKGAKLYGAIIRFSLEQLASLIIDVARSRMRRKPPREGSTDCLMPWGDSLLPGPLIGGPGISRLSTLRTLRETPVDILSALPLARAVSAHARCARGELLASQYPDEPTHTHTYIPIDTYKYIWIHMNTNKYV